MGNGSQELLTGLEDKAIIERQQKTLEEDPGFLPQMLAILSDAPLAHFRRALGKLIDAEQAPAAPAAVAPANAVAAVR